jgi:YggT family protein
VAVVFAAGGVRSLIADLLYLYAFIIFVRALLSWFPRSPGSAVTRIDEVLGRITDPVLAPVRRAMPSLGMIDLSPMVVMLACLVLAQFIG